MKTTFTNDFSEEIWRTTYKYHEDKNIDDTLKRVAKAVASVEDTEIKREEWSSKFYDMLSEFKCTSGGRIYANAGTDYSSTTMLNCYVGPEVDYDKDSLKGILKVLSDQSHTLKSEGGWGYNFSFIRPRGAFIYGIGVETPGSVRYMELFDKSSDIITSGSGISGEKNKKKKGKIRKGAMMGVLDCWHPDIIEFITAKQAAGKLSKFNISVNCTNEFMDLVKQNDDTLEWDLIFPETTHSKYKEEWKGDIDKWREKGYPVKVYKTVNVQWLWDLIMKSTYNRAEPGVLFLDRANELNELNYRSKIYATNPCGEQFLEPSGVCNLGSINLAKFVSDGCFDYSSIEKYARYLVRFLDNVNSVTLAPLTEYKDFAENARRIGVGVLGWASFLYLMNIRFGSSEAAEIRDKVMKLISHAVVDESINLAEEKGCFKWCDKEKHADAKWFKQIELPESQLDRIRDVGIRNSSLMSIQPTGNTSIFANVVSGGIEPIFAQEYIRTSIVPEVPSELKDKCPRYWEGDMTPNQWFVPHKEGDEDMLIYKSKDFTYKIDSSRGLTKETLCEDYAVNSLKKAGKWDSEADWAVTAMSLTAQDHVSDLVGFAKYIDSAISKTINIPNDYPYDQFKDLYVDAYNTGYIKGLTTYRSGTMTAVLSEKGDSTEEEKVTSTDIKLPDDSPARMKILHAEGKKWYLTVVYHEDTGKPFALFCRTNSREKTVQTYDAVEKLIELGKSKGILEEHIDDTMKKICTEANVDKLTRTISLLLRHGVAIRNIVTCLNKVEDVFIGSFLFQVRKFLSQYIKDGEEVDGESCPECGSKMVYSEGCMKCNDCGYSKCG